MQQKTKQIIIMSCLSFMFLALLIVGTFFDLEISRALAIKTDGYFTTDAFTMFFESFGENILYLLCGCAFAIIVWYLRKVENKKLRVCLQILFSALGFAIWFFCAHRTLGYIGEHLGEIGEAHMSKFYVTLIEFFTAIVLNTLTIFCFRGFSEDTINKLFKWALVVIIAAAVSNGIVQGLKIFWGRYRYRAMNLEGSFENFTPWYIICGKRDITTAQELLGIATDAYKSFPSGHTCAASSIFLIALLPSLFDRLNNKCTKIVLWTIPSVYTAVVALSRIMCGAHFFTDVLISFIITFVVIMLAKWLVINNGYKKFKKKQQTGENN